MAIAVQRSRDVRFYEILPLADEPLSVEPVQMKKSNSMEISNGRKSAQETSNEWPSFARIFFLFQFLHCIHGGKTAKIFEISHLNLN